MRGRFAERPHVRWSVEAPPNGLVPPLGRDALGDAVRRAAVAWQETGAATFEQGADGALLATATTAHVVIGWRRGAHDGCEPFGVGGGIAHTGPFGPSTFVHLDADRSWTEDALDSAVLHELGHVLGLGHSEAPGALMACDADLAQRGLTESERAGLASLYGGGRAGAGDVAVEVDRQRTCVLRRVAPPDRADFDVWDVDGDGDDELVVWRTDHAGGGALQVYHFDAGPRLARTAGPWYGVVEPGAQVALDVTTDGERVAVSARPDGALVVRVIRTAGGIEVWAPGRPLRLALGTLDDDGDGRLDGAPGGVARALPAPRRVGDLDGDGRRDAVSLVAAR